MNATKITSAKAVCLSADTAANHAHSVTEKVIAGKKYLVRTVCTGASNKNVQEALLQLAERRAIREMGLS